MEWKLSKEPFPKKVKASRSAVKVMLTSSGTPKLIVLPACTNMNKEYYSDLIRSLKREMIRKRKKKNRKGHALLLQDNAPPHRAGVTMATSWTSTLVPWLSSFRLFSIPWNEEAAERPSLWRQRRDLCRHRGVAISSATPLLLWRTFQGQKQMAEIYIFGWWLGWEIKVSMQKI